MEAIADSAGYELRVLHAAADGVEPALLLSAPGKKAEYLLNVPDGFSRLALEHRSTPSGRLSCILLTSLLPAATGGLGGLMLRLRHDGHGQVQILGPTGTTAIVHALRHVCRWRHPKVFVSECCGNRPVPVFEDEHIVIVPIADGDQTTGCPWCLYGASETSTIYQRKGTTTSVTRASSSHDCSSSDSSESSVSNEDLSDTGCSSEGERLSASRGSSSILPQRRKREENLQLSSPDEIGELNLFKQVRLKLDKSKRDRMNVFSVLPGESRKIQPPRDRSTSESSFIPIPRSSTQREKETRDEQFETGRSGFETSRASEQATSIVRSEGGKEGKLNSGVCLTEHFDWLIHNSQEVELPDVGEEANPVFQLSPSPDKQQDTTSETERSIKRGPSSVLGYICYLRKLDAAVLIVDCKSSQHLESLRIHPLLRCSHSPGLRFKEGEDCKGNEHLIAAVVDLSPRNMIQLRDYKLWVESLRSSGPHVVVKGARDEFGFQSSLGTLVKLNCIHTKIFPIPPGMDLCSDDTQVSSKQTPGRDEKVLDAVLCMRLIFQKSRTLVDHSLCPVKLKKLQEERRQMSVDCAVTGDDGGIQSACTPPVLSANGAAAATLRKNLQQQNAVTLTSDSSLQPPHSQDTALHIQQEGSLQSLNYSRQFTPKSRRTPLSGREEMSSCELEADFQLVFFGTGCAEPSKKRGSSGILLQVKGTDRAMLLEAGEGVAGQFVRRFDDVNAQRIICTLGCLWLSHKHGDHVLGVLSILEARRQQKEPLVVIGPQKVGLWLSEVTEIRAAMGCPVPEFHFIRCQDLAVSGRFLEKQEDRKQFDRVLSSMHLQSLRLVRVLHCFDAYGIILRGQTGWSVVYSGDTRPCKSLEYAGQGCSVLIHEATFEDELIEQAKQKRHCTVSEALKAGLQMGAEHIILTHFSQRYPEMVAMCSDQTQRVSVAFDGMVVPSHLLLSLSKLLPLISSVCQKMSKTKSKISDQVLDENQKLTDHVLRTKADVVADPTSVELGDDSSGTNRLAAASLHSSLTRLNMEYEGCPTANPKHIRWPEKSDDEDVEGPPADVLTENVAINWSSNSDEEGPFQLLGSKCRFRPHIRSVVAEKNAVALMARDPSFAAERVTDFDRLISPVTAVCAEDEEGHGHLANMPRGQKSTVVRRRRSKKLPLNIRRRNELHTPGDHFLKNVGTCGTLETAELYDIGYGSQPSRIVSGGGEHIRWTDSDTEDSNCKPV